MWKRGKCKDHFTLHFQPKSHEIPKQTASPARQAAYSGQLTSNIALCLL